ncbi:IS3 family transposase [Xiamenia xianingshaonis]|nr:IS3 family transposase [Xiamenia xianingshaonis]QTU84258.1 IS3 family transposase [Xiamenia xianingshaonis]
MALGLAYGDHGFTLDQVAVMVGVSAPTISIWKKKRMEGGAMEIPEIDPDEIEKMRSKDIGKMSKGELERYVHELEVKSYVLEGTVKILKAEGIEELSNDEKAALIDARPRNIAVAEMLEELDLPSSSYYYCRSKPEREDGYADARRAIKEEFELVRGSRGYRYIRQRLREREEPIRISGKKVRALMAEEGCVVAYAKRKRRYSSYRGEIGDAPENLVGRNFHAGGPNELWLTDVTQFSIPAGKIYLSPVIDCFDGMPVSWAIRKSPNAEMANTMLRSACETIGGGEAPVIHSDRGCHYRWPGWLKICEDNGLVRSMSKKGCSEMDRVLWKDKDCIQIKQLWGYLCTYCYLPRLASYGVLENAIRQGLTSKEYFGIVAEVSEGRYMELSLGENKAFINQSDFLVKPAVAKAQIEADAEEARREAERWAAAAAAAGDGDADANGNKWTFTPVDTTEWPNMDGSGTMTTTTVKVDVTPASGDPIAFRMTAKPDNTCVNKNIRDIMDEIVSQLTTLDGAEVELSLEVIARVDSGIPVPAVRAISENCNTMHINDFGFTRKGRTWQRKRR